MKALSAILAISFLTSFAQAGFAECKIPGNKTLTYGIAYEPRSSRGRLALSINREMKKITSATPTTNPKGINIVFENQGRNTFLWLPDAACGNFTGQLSGQAISCKHVCGE